MSDLTSMAPDQCKAKIELLGTYDPQGERIIQDPYYVSQDLLLYIFENLSNSYYCLSLI